MSFEHLELDETIRQMAIELQEMDSIARMEGVIS